MAEDEEKRKAGRPAKWTDPEAMEAAIRDYFKKCEDGETVTRPNKRGELVTYTRKIPYTVAGLALALGFNSRQSLLDYCGGKNRDSARFVDTISRAKTMIEQENITRAALGDYDAKIMTLNLSANFGYSTKAQVEVNGLEDVLRGMEGQENKG